MAKKNKLKSESWEIIALYREPLGLEKELILTEIIEGRTMRTFQEYYVWVRGTEYKKGNEIKKVAERKEKIFVRQYIE